MTQFLHRLLIILPVARVPSFGTWFAANIDPNDDCSTWPALNATGDPDAPPTHRWSNGSYTEPQAKLLLGRLAQVSGIQQPANWDSMTPQEKRDWAKGKQGEIRSKLGAYIVPIDNLGRWDDPQEALTAMNLQTLRSREARTV